MNADKNQAWAELVHATFDAFGVTTGREPERPLTPAQVERLKRAYGAMEQAGGPSCPSCGPGSPTANGWCPRCGYTEAKEV